MNITNIIAVSVICFFTTPLVSGERARERRDILEEQFRTIEKIQKSYRRQQAIVLQTKVLDLVNDKATMGLFTKDIKQSRL